VSLLGISQNGIDSFGDTVRQNERMQLIRAFEIDPEGYVREDVHLKVLPPSECPHCSSAGTLWSLGYYHRSISRLTAGLLRLSIRRFRCRGCGKTVSILPSFAQPYRFVQNSTIERFVQGGPWSNDVIRCLPLLQIYWRKFVAWLPDVESTLEGVLPRPPPTGDAQEWWTLLIGIHGGLNPTTATLVSTYRVTLFGRYQCHWPNSGHNVAG
jgi:hypothetical protein